MNKSSPTLLVSLALYLRLLDGCNFQLAAQYIADKFSGLNRNPEKKIYPHITTATDTSNIQYVFKAVADIILRKSLAKSGVI
jgi:hypothetical protein